MTSDRPFFIPPSDLTKPATGFNLVLNQAVPAPGSFNSCVKKLSRAGAHIAALEDTISQYILSSPLSLTNEVKENNVDGTNGPNITIERFNQPPEIGLIVGDIIHNLRASLDSLAGDLAIRSGNSPKGVYFPIVYAERDLSHQIRDKKFHRAGKDCEELLRSFCPWNGGSKYLRGLHELDIIDKHTTIAPVTMNAVSPMLSLTGEEGIVGTGIVPDSIIFTFAETGPFGNEELVSTIHGIAETVKSIIEAFAKLIADRPYQPI